LSLMTRQRFGGCRLSLTRLLAATGPAAAQQRSASREGPDARVAVLDVAMYNAQAGRGPLGGHGEGQQDQQPIWLFTPRRLAGR